MLTDRLLKSLKPKDKQYKEYDAGKLYVLIHPNGGIYWRLDYTYADKNKTLAIGVYPKVSIKEAREAQKQALALLSQGIDPMIEKKRIKQFGHLEQQLTFKAVALEYYDHKKGSITDKELAKQLSRINKRVLPVIGNMPITDIKAPYLLSISKSIAKEGHLDLAKRVVEDCGLIFKFAIASGYCEYDPTQGIKKALPKHVQQHFASVIDPKAVASLLKQIYSYKGTAITQYALKLVPLFFVRIGELRTAKWADIDLEAKQWSYTVTKTKTPHIVPLSTQAIALLTELKKITGTFSYVFAGRDPKKPMSDSTINKALQRMGYDTKADITGHGFRAMARTLLAERLHFAPEIIEHQLAHSVADNLGTAYNRTKYLDQRTKMMQVWSDYLDNLRLDKNVIPFSAKVS